MGWLVSEPVIRIIDADGSDGDQTLDAQEQALLDGALKLLQADLEFQQHYPNAVLSVVESNRGVKDGAHGRLYLQFTVPGRAATEFWAHWGKKAGVAFKSGSVTVPPPS